MEVVVGDHFLLHEVVTFSYEQISWVVPHLKNRSSKYTCHYILHHIEIHIFLTYNLYEKYMGVYLGTLLFAHQYKYELQSDNTVQKYGLHVKIILLS